MKNFFDIFNDDNIIKASECYAFSQQQSLIYGVAGTQKSLIIRVTIHAIQITPAGQ